MDETPVEKEARAKAIKEQKDRAIAAAEKRAKELEEARIAINGAKEDNNVRIILRHVCKESGIFGNPCVVNGNKEITNASTYNMGRQSVYHDIRKLMSDETKNLVERSE